MISTNLLNKINLVSLILALLTGVRLWSQVPGSVSDVNSYDFGLIPIGTVIHHTFTVSNSGKKSLIVGKIITSCACTSVESFPKRIAAGDRGDFVVTMDHQHAGYTDISIYVTTGPALHDLHVFHMVGVLVDRAPVSPSNPAILSAKEVLTTAAALKDVALIDVRPTPFFVAAHVPGSLNLPPFALEARQDLKAKEVLLINDGIDDPVLFARIDHLKSMGFQNVHLLEGGLRAWQLAGGAIQGSAPPQSSSVGMLSKNDFYTQQRNPTGWLVVTMDKVAGNIPTATPVKNIVSGLDPKAFVARLSAVIAANTDISHVVITSNLGNDYDRIEPELRSAKLSVLFYYLQGGSSAYTQYVEEQTLSLNPLKIIMDTSKASLASNQANGQVVHGGGCAGCGH